MKQRKDAEDSPRRSSAPGRRNALGRPRRSAKQARSGADSARTVRRPAGSSSDARTSRSRRLANPRRRGRAMFIALLFVFTIFAAQLVRLQAIDADTIAQQAQDLRSRPTTVPAVRGEIEDRFGAPLAESSERFDVVADQVAVAEYTKKDPQTRQSVKVGVAGAAADLSGVLGIDAGELERQLTGDKPWVPIARSVMPTTWLKVQELGIPGTTSELKPVRYYPGGEPAAATVGWVGADGTAADNTGGGLEYLYDQALTGRPGRMVREYSLDDRVIPMGHSEIDPAVPGEAIRTTIDSDLNWYAYDAIAKRVEEVGAEAGIVVIMDKEGRLLTVAQAPTFDPADRSKEGADFSNMAFQGAFEPGSIAKIVTAGAALDLGLTAPTDKWVIPNRYSTPNGQEFRDSHDHATEYLTTAGIMAKSSNIGTVMLSELYSREQLAEYMGAFGMGQRTAVGFPGESAGYLGDPKSWDGRSRYTISFGQAFTATPVQVTGIMQTIANKGMHVPPSLVAGRTDAEGEYHAQPLPQGNQAVDEKTADALSRMLESVVSAEGTAVEAKVPGFNIAGKTGTSNRYTGERGYVSSFVGYAPAEQPEFVMGVFLINPKENIYGGYTAGPVFSSVMSYALQKYGVAPSQSTIEEFPLEYSAPQGATQTVPGPGRLSPEDEAAVPEASKSSENAGQNGNNQQAGDQSVGPDGRG